MKNLESIQEDFVKSQNQIRLLPHKIVNNVVVLLSGEELIELNKPQPKEEIIANLKLIKIEERKKVLSENDWRFSRQVRCGELVDPEIVLKLNQYNEEIDQIRKFTTVKEFDNLTKI